MAHDLEAKMSLRMQPGASARLSANESGKSVFFATVESGHQWTSRPLE